MTVKAKVSITISRLIDISSVTRYYLLQSSTSDTPAKPTTNPPPDIWTDSEPSYSVGSTNTLYFVDLTEFTDNTFSYSKVSKSSNYEAIEKLDQQIDNNTKTISANTNATNEAVENLKSAISDAENNLQNEIDNLKSSVTELFIDNDEVKIQVNKLYTDGIDRVETSTGFSFNEDGLNISKTNGAVNTTITENGMTIQNNDNKKLLVANDSGVDAVNLHASTYLVIGDNSRFEDYNDTRTACFWTDGGEYGSTSSGGIISKYDYLNNRINDVYEDLNTSKQDKLTAGTNITIDENNVISATNSGGSIDQTYDALSENAQSGKAVSEAANKRMPKVINAYEETAVVTVKGYTGDDMLGMEDSRYSCERISSTDGLTGDFSVVSKSIPSRDSKGNLQSGDPAKDYDVAPKKYVDDALAQIGGGGSIAVDQTYNSTSENAQSGKAVAEAVIDRVPRRALATTAPFSHVVSIKPYPSTQDIGGMPYPKDTDYGYLEVDDGFSKTDSSIEHAKGFIAARDKTTGNLWTGTPADDEDCINKKYLEEALQNVSIDATTIPTADKIPKYNQYGQLIVNCTEYEPGTETAKVYSGESVPRDLWKAYINNFHQRITNVEFKSSNTESSLNNHVDASNSQFSSILNILNDKKISFQYATTDTEVTLKSNCIYLVIDHSGSNNTNVYITKSDDTKVVATTQGDSAVENFPAFRLSLIIVPNDYYHTMVIGQTGRLSLTNLSPLYTKQVIWDNTNKNMFIKTAGTGMSIWEVNI